MKFTGLLLFFAMAIATATAQYHPAENDTLNYTMAGFTVPENKKASQYRLEIAEGINNNITFFNRNIISRTTSAENNIIHTLPALGRAYTWRVVYLGKKGKEAGTTPLMHFYTGIMPYADTSLYRLRIADTAKHHKDILVFCDRTRTLYNVKGEPVWFLPNIPGVLDNNTSVRDLKATSFGTLTFLVNDRAHEITYDGKIVWTAPNDGKISRDTSEYYHHEFTRLENGNYMIAGNEMVYRKLKDVTDTSFIKRNGMIEKRGDKYFYKLAMGTIIEYDSAKNIVWAWKSSGYFTDADLFTKKSPKGEPVASTHQNSFFFDEKERCIYTSFRDINRIVKIEYPSGKVLAEYGENYLHNPAITADGLFYGQHCCRTSAAGDLYLFNNNFKGRGAPLDASASAITVIKQPAAPGAPAKLVREFSCDFDGTKPTTATAGGSVYELEDQCFLVCMGSINKIFIVDNKGHIVWNAYTEMKTNGLWQPVDSYRSGYIIPGPGLEKLILKRN